MWQTTTHASSGTVARAHRDHRFTMNAWMRSVACFTLFLRAQGSKGGEDGGVAPPPVPERLVGFGELLRQAEHAQAQVGLCWSAWDMRIPGVLLHKCNKQCVTQQDLADTLCPACRSRLWNSSAFLGKSS